MPPPSTSTLSPRRHDKTQSASTSTSASAHSPTPSTSGSSRMPSLRRRHLDGRDHTHLSSAPPANGVHDDNASRTSADSHPLDVDLSDTPNTEYHDVSRPTLRRLTSETERQIAESSSASVASHSEGSTRGSSFDLLRMSPAEESKEVEVLVHHVKPNESLAGIALLYGIDLPTLRKINKLWASDSVHLRTVLYVPIEACRWNKASETFIRGPGPAQITLVPKHTSTNRKGKAPVRSPEPDLASSSPSRTTSPPFQDDENEYDEWGSVPSPARTYIDDTNIAYEGLSRASLDSIRPSRLASEGDEPPEQRVVDVVRMPNSQLRFFPKSQAPPDTRRTSLEQDMRRVSLERGLRRSVSLRYAAATEDGPSIQNDLRTLPPPLQPKDRPLDATIKSNNVVKIRPQVTTRTSSSTGSITDRLTSFFSIPPPPNDDPRFSPIYSSPISPKPRQSVDSSFSTKSRRSSGISPTVLLEMHPRANGKKTVKPNKKTD